MAKFEILFNKSLWLTAIIFCLMAFVISVQDKNNAGQPLIEEKIFNETFAFLEQNTSSNKNILGEQYSIFTEEKPNPSFGSIVLFSIVGASKTIGNVIVGTFLILIKLPVFVLGISETLVNLVVTWLTIAILLALWFIWKFG